MQFPVLAIEVPSSHQEQAGLPVPFWTRREKFAVRPTSSCCGSLAHRALRAGETGTASWPERPRFPVASWAETENDGTPVAPIETVQELQGPCPRSVSFCHQWQE